MDTYRYLDHQAQEHTAYDHLQAQAERLVEYALKYREKLHWDLQQENYSLSGKYGQRYATTNKHAAKSRIDAAFNILESFTFDLPDNWQPGQAIFVESETLELAQKGYTCLLTRKYGKVSQSKCGCVDWQKHSVQAGIVVLYLCKHLMTYWLLEKSYEALRLIRLHEKPVEEIQRELFG